MSLSPFASKNLVFVARFVVALIVVALAIWLGKELSTSETAQLLVARFGYGGVILISIVSGFNVVVPIPAIAFVPLFLAGGLSMVGVVFSIALGVAIGDMIGYFLGSASRALMRNKIEKGKIFQAIERFRERHVLLPYVFLFFFVSLAPVPNEIVVIPMAFAGYRLRYIFPVVVVGSLIFATLGAFSVLAL